ncbi:MAG: lipase family protein [Burkholderiaceae bacterium]
MSIQELKLCFGKAVSTVMLTTVIAACGSDTPLPAAGDVVSATDLSLPDVTAAASKQLITYRMPGVSGGLVEATAVVLIPAGTPPAGGWPVVGWGHGTTGVADACAPSALLDLATYDTYLNAFVQGQFAVVAADYEGLGTPGTHPYLHLDSEGRSMLHAIKAASLQYPSLSSRYALLGHSQGGHAAIGAAELATAGEVSGLSLVGVVALAPASQIRTQGAFLASVANNPAANLLDRVPAAIGRIGFTSLILAGIEAVDASFDDATGYGPDGGFIPDLVAQQCLSGISASLSSPIQDALFADNNIEAILPNATESLPAVSSYLEMLEPGLRPITGPVLILQGDADTTVFPSSTQSLVNLMANQGNSVSLEVSPGEDHSTIVESTLIRALEFIRDQFANSAQ